MNEPTSTLVPRIVITAGEPAGIGPDVVLAAAQQAWPAELVCVADQKLLGQRAQALGLSIDLRPFSSGQTPTATEPGTLKVVDIPLSHPAHAGQLDARNAAYVLATLNQAVEMCRCGEADAMVTGPVQKSVINDSGIRFSGHTEFLAELTDTPRVVMLLAAGDLRVALATTHLPLSQVPTAVTQDKLHAVLTVLHGDLQKKFGIPKPRIAVLGLNPHAGEGGHLGREEIDIITPVINRARDAGMKILGPLPADTAFSEALRAETDAYLAMYHDQGLPVLKYAGFGNAVNITLGLPIIRTSVDHGTALALAGTGRADSGSLRAAIHQAIAMVGNRDNP